MTRLLIDWSGGDRAAFDRLLPLVYDELRRLARSYLARERPDHTLQPTALVNEAYLRLVGQDRVQWQSRAHFFGIAAQIMRRLLVDSARASKAVKRGAGAERISIELVDVPEAAGDIDLEALDQALERLAERDPRQSRIVELRYFAGATNEETAEALGISVATVKREWTIAKAWLHKQLTR